MYLSKGVCCVSHRVGTITVFSPLFCAPLVALAHVESRLPLATGILGRLLTLFHKAVQQGLDIVEIPHSVLMCLEELVSGLLRPKLFPFGKLSKAKPAAQSNLTLHKCECVG